MASGNLFTLCSSSHVEEDTVVCEHCNVLDSILMNLVGRKVTDVIMKRVTVELHHPADNLKASSIDCTIPS